MRFSPIIVSLRWYKEHGTCRAGSPEKRPVFGRPTARCRSSGSGLLPSAGNSQRSGGLKHVAIVAARERLGVPAAGEAHGGPHLLQRVEIVLVAPRGKGVSNPAQFGGAAQHQRRHEL